MRHPSEFIIRRLASRSLHNPSTGCLEWRRSTRGGYGRLWDGEKLRDAHRLAYEMHAGPIPPGLDVLHRCDNPCCIEPSHLWVGTHAENMADRDVKGRHRNGARRGRVSHMRGAEHPRARIDEAQARQILALRGVRRGADVARDFNVSDALVRGIWDGRNWGWLSH